METLLVPEKPGCTTLLLIDYFVKDNAFLIESTNDVTLPILYSYKCSKPQLLDAIQSRFITIDRIGILFTYGNANLFLDEKHFFVQENVDFVAGLVRTFGVKHLDFLACETLSYPAWTHYYNTLHEATGVTIGASINQTGNRPLFSDWIMENTGENIAPIYFKDQVKYYKYLLDNPEPKDGSGCNV